MIGVDEVGRGSWAGPLLVVAARQNKVLSSDIDDSKKISKTIRIKLVDEIKDKCDLGEGWVWPNEIDDIGLTAAMYLAVQRALDLLEVAVDEEIIMDGNINYCDSKYLNSKSIIKADSTVPVVGAASIYAKVTRDEYMEKLALLFPEYGFEAHVGYGTKRHMESIKLNGVTIHHRLSYKPIAKLIST